MVRFYLSQSKKLFWQMPYYSLSPPLVGGSKYKHTGHMIERSLSCDLLFNNIIIIIIAITITITIIVIVTVIVIVIICIPTFQQIWWWAISLGLILAFALRRLFVKLPAPNHLVIIIIINLSSSSPCTHHHRHLNYCNNKLCHHNNRNHKYFCP